MSAPKKRETISSTEAAEILNLTRQTVLLLFRKGQLEGYKVTNGLTARVEFYRDSVIKYAREVQKRKDV